MPRVLVSRDPPDRMYYVKENLTVPEFVAASLANAGVDTAFGLVGTHVVELFDVFAKFGIQVVTTCHEGNAGFMADAYARVSKRPAALVGTAGPGFLNCTNSIAQCWVSATPIVVVTGGVEPSAKTRSLHALSNPEYTHRIAEQITKLAIRPTTIEEVARQVPEALDAMLSDTLGPVHIEIDWDLMQSKCVVPSILRDSRSAPARKEALGSVAAPKLPKSPFVVFCIDQIVQRYGLEAEIIAAAERQNACIVCSYNAFGAVPTTHRLFGGIVSDFASGTAAFANIAACDHLVSFGDDEGSETEDLIRRSLQVGTPYSKLRTRAEIEQYLEKEILELDGGLPNLRQAAKEWRGAAVDAFQDLSKDEHIGALMEIVVDSLDSEDVVVLDAGSHELWCRSMLQTTVPSRIIGSGMFGSMGYALPGVIGAKLADTTNRVVGITGDGCLLMSSSDLLTLSRVKGCAVLVVFNNSRYDEIARAQERRGLIQENVDIPAIDFSAIATAYGMKSYKTHSCDELRSALDGAFSHDGPTLIDARCRPGSPWPEFP